MAATSIDRDWIAAELLKIVAAERSIAIDAKARAESPPLPVFSVLYHEIADQDERHVAVLETIATRYGHTPKREPPGRGVGKTLGRLKDKVVAAGANPIDLIRQDLSTKANLIDWQLVWAHTLESIDDIQSARDLTSILTEDQAHHSALLEGLNRLVEQHVSVPDTP
jgi:hypothetical protein